MPTLWRFLVCAVLLVATEEAYSPARLREGKTPPIPVNAISGGEVRVELDVNVEGQVTRATPLRTTPPFTDLVTAATGEWRFFAAREVVHPDGAAPGAPLTRVAVPSHVLVVAMFRPPAIDAPTLGEAPQDARSGSESIPFPVTTTMPPYPPTALGNGVVLLEARVSAIGMV